MSNSESKRSTCSEFIELAELRAKIAVLESERAPREQKLSLAVSFDAAKSLRIKQLENELAEWRKLRDPGHLFDQLASGVPAQLHMAQVQQLLAILQVGAEGNDSGVL